MSHNYTDSGLTPREVLREVWGYDSFRAGQEDIINSVLDGHDTLGLMATGGGKSLTFQVPALLLDGITLVITPLISLMKDQVDNLAARDVRAGYLFSGQTRREANLVLDRCRLGIMKLLYISPERLRSAAFIDECRRWKIALIVVDEAHCISQWGYDFRPSYLKIAELRKIVPDAPVLALTASATPLVRDDIVRRLEFRPGFNIFTQTFDRDNISYVVRHTVDKIGKLVDILTKVGGSAIVYVRSRVRTKETARVLADAGISADFYHAGLAVEDKTEKQNAWKEGRTRVMVATNAFGMGIDKPDVRVVVHLDLPPSLEEYYQEAGRAGRDGKHSYAVILASQYDKSRLTKALNEAYPPRDFIRAVYERAMAFCDIAIGGGYNEVFEFDLGKFCKMFELQPRPVLGAFALLGQAGYFEFVEDPSSRGRVMVLAHRDELYSIDMTPIEDKVLNALLRNYTGLFSEYVNISEQQIAQYANVTEEDVYQAMLVLTRMHVLHYIPRRKLPFIFMETSREETRYITIPNIIYEERRELMKLRLDAMKEFAFGGTRCRSQVLLEYFGETDTHPCGRCDICREVLRVQPADSDWQYIDRAIIHMAGHRGGESVDELLDGIRGARPDIMQRIRALADAGTIVLANRRVSLPPQK